MSKNRYSIEEQIFSGGWGFITLVFLLLFFLDNARWSAFVAALTNSIFAPLLHQNARGLRVFASYDLYFYLWFVASICWFAGLLMFFRWRDEKRYGALSSSLDRETYLRKLRRMTPAKFEDYVAYLFSKLGYKTEAIGGPGDGGVDVVAIDEKGIKHYIQCKKYVNRKVTVSDMRDFYGAMIDKLAGGKCYFVTTTIFTWDAENFAKDKPIELIDGSELFKFIKRAGVDNEEVKVEDNLVCSECGGKLVLRTAKKGSHAGEHFYGCSKFPQCKYIKNI